MKKWKRGLASLLSAVMLFSMLPTSVFATEEASAYGGPVSAVAEDAEAEAVETAEAAPDAETEVVETAEAAPDAEAEAVETAETAPDAEAEAVETAEAAPDAEAEAVETAEAAPDAEAEAVETAEAAPDRETETALKSGDDEEEPAYEVSYNLSGAGYWITVGQDKKLADEDDRYVLFDENGDYDIQLRETDDFSDGYKVEVRYRMKAGDTWTVPQTVTFLEPNKAVTVAGHKFRAQSKWLTKIGYSFNVNANEPDVTPAQDAYDEDGNYAMDFPPDERFPLTVRFWYQTRKSVEDGYSDWQRTYVATPDEEEHDPVYKDMNDAFNILGRAFSFSKKTIGLVQYRYPDGDWVNIGPGQNITNPDGSVLEEREFDAHGNYTLDMGNRTDFPIRVYFRALEADGWKYLSGAAKESESEKRYVNVFDTANINGHVFSIHTTWMNDVRYAFFDETALNEAKNDYTLTDEALSWTTIGNGPGAYRPFEKDGSYTIGVSSDKNDPQEYPFFLIFKSISPTGKWDTISDWTTAETRMSHLRYFENVDDKAEYEGHTFYLTSSNLGDITFTVRNGDGTVTHPLITMVQDKSRLEENDGNNNYEMFDADNSYTIELTEADTFPLTVTFNALDKNGWSDDIIWEIPFRGWEQSQKVIRVLNADYTFRLSIAFLGDTRYRWSDYASWNYVVPDYPTRRYSNPT